MGYFDVIFLSDIISSIGPIISDADEYYLFIIFFQIFQNLAFQTARNE